MSGAEKAVRKVGRKLDPTSKKKGTLGGSLLGGAEAREAEKTSVRVGEEQALAQEAASGVVQGALASAGSQLESGFRGAGGELSRGFGEARDDITMAGLGAQQRLTGAAGLFDPFSQAGTGALAEQQALLGLGGQQAQQAAMARLEASPALAFQRQQGEQAIQRALAAQGRLRSGQTLQELTEFNQQLAGQALNQRLAQLGGLAQQGLGATQQQAALGAQGAGMTQQQGSQLAGLATGLGTRQAALEQARAAAQAGITEQIGQTAAAGLTGAAAARAGGELGAAQIGQQHAGVITGLTTQLIGQGAQALMSPTPTPAA